MEIKFLCVSPDDSVGSKVLIPIDLIQTICRRKAESWEGSYITFRQIDPSRQFSAANAITVSETIDEIGTQLMELGAAV